MRYPQEVEDVDVAVVRAVFGIAETGSVLFTQDQLIVNAVAYLAQHLVVLLDPADILPNVQAAYRRPEFGRSAYAVLHTGPSATADIEGVLIHGAQGVRSLTVVMQRKQPEPEPAIGRAPCLDDGEVVVRQGDPMRYTLGCSLSYNILSDTTFIFNLEVARLKSVEILSESLVLTPNLKRDIYITRISRTVISASMSRRASSLWNTMPKSTSPCTGPIRRASARRRSGSCPSISCPSCCRAGSSPRTA